VLSQGVSTTASLPFLLARWLDGRLHDSIGFALTGHRLYGLEVIDPSSLADGEPLAARMSFIAQAADEQSLLADPGSPSVVGFDAAAFAWMEWRTVADGPLRPGQYPVRRRARIVHVLAREGEAIVTRFEHHPDVVVLAQAS